MTWYYIQTGPPGTRDLHNVLAQGKPLSGALIVQVLWVRLYDCALRVWASGSSFKIWAQTLANKHSSGAKPEKPKNSILLTTHF